MRPPPPTAKGDSTEGWRARDDVISDGWRFRCQLLIERNESLSDRMLHEAGKVEYPQLVHDLPAM